MLIRAQCILKTSPTSNSAATTSSYSQKELLCLCCHKHKWEEKKEKKNRSFFVVIIRKSEAGVINNFSRPPHNVKVSRTSNFYISVRTLQWLSGTSWNDRSHSVECEINLLLSHLNCLVTVILFWMFGELFHCWTSSSLRLPFEGTFFQASILIFINSFTVHSPFTKMFIWDRGWAAFWAFQLDELLDHLG